MSGPASLFLAFAPSCLLVVPVPYMAPVATDFGIEIRSQTRALRLTACFHLELCLRRWTSRHGLRLEQTGSCPQPMLRKYSQIHWLAALAEFPAAHCSLTGAYEPACPIFPGWVSDRHGAPIAQIHSGALGQRLYPHYHPAHDPRNRRHSSGGNCTSASRLFSRGNEP